MVIPPVLLYAFGAVLAVMGGLRAVFLGWKQRPDVPEAKKPVSDAPGDDIDDEDGASVRGEIRGRDPQKWSDGKTTAAHKRHIAMGALWVALGLFLIISTAINQR